MAKNTEGLTTTLQAQATPVLGAGGTYEGTFKGNLIGNADTATALKAPMTLTFTGDATGAGTTDGTSTTIQMSVAKAAIAERSKTADTALHTDVAATAGKATFADTAGTANTAGSATTATVADHAKTSDEAMHATKADSSLVADRTPQATHADEADHALEADEAKHALTADTLSGHGDPIPEAVHAQKADLAVMAQYDCEGRSIKDLYVRHAQLPKDTLTEREAKALFLEQSKAVLQATIRGKAFGHGVVRGNTLEILINELAVDNNGVILADFIKFEDVPLDNADTTKIYIDTNNNFNIFDHDNAQWVKVEADLSVENQQKLDEALAKINTAVTTDGDQAITGIKTFKDEIRTEIADLDVDNPRRAVVVHNLKDTRDSLKAEIFRVEHSFEKELMEISKQIDAQGKGDVLFAYKNYSDPSQQADMVVGTTYIGFLTEQKAYIQIDPSTNQPLDPLEIPFYYRYYIKGATGKVTWVDKTINLDLSGYAQLKGAIFTGNISVPDIPIETSDETVFNSKRVQELVAQKDTDLENKINIANYIPKTGGEYTGVVKVPKSADVGLADNKDVLNKEDTQSLIDTSIKAIPVKTIIKVVSDGTPIDTENVLYFIE